MSGLSWTLSVAARECGVSKSTLKRRLTEDAFPHAFKDSSGSWKIPVGDLIAAGLEPGRPSPGVDQTQSSQKDQPSQSGYPEPGQSRSEEEKEQVRELQLELAQERERAQALAQANRDLREHLNDMRMALRMLEATPRESNAAPLETPPAQLTAENSAPSEASPASPARPRGWLARLLGL